MPPTPAGPLKVTVPVVDVPPKTEFGETVKTVRPGALIVSVVLAVELPRVAVIVADTVLDTAVVVTVNVALE